MKSLFIVLMTLIAASLSFAQSTPAKKSANVLCDVKQWGDGKTYMNDNDFELTLQAGEDEDVPMYNPEFLEAKIPTPAGPVTVTYDSHTLKVHYTLVLGNQAAPLFAEGKSEAKMTVFLGPQVGYNNGLTVGCRLASPAATQSANGIQSTDNPNVTKKYPYVLEHWK